MGESKYLAIRGIATLLLIENGEVLNTQLGAASVSQVRAFVGE